MNTGKQMNRRIIAMNIHQQKGASLLEGIAYLGIAAIVVLGAISLLTSASASARANQATGELIAVRTAVKKLYSGQSYPVASLIETLVSAKALPSTLAVSGSGATTALSNSWGGAVTISGTTSSTFTIAYPSVPQDACVNMLSGMSGWNSVGNGTTTVSTSPLTTTNATTLCASDTNSISFVGS